MKYLTFILFLSGCTKCMECTTKSVTTSKFQQTTTATVSASFPSCGAELKQWDGRQTTTVVEAGLQEYTTVSNTTCK